MEGKEMKIKLVDGIEEGFKVNKLFRCPECEKKFRLKVDGKESN